MYEKERFKKEVLMITQGIGDIDLTEFLSHGRENLNQNITEYYYIDFRRLNLKNNHSELAEIYIFVHIYIYDIKIDHLVSLIQISYYNTHFI